MTTRFPAFSTRTRGLIQARSGGRCERCSGQGREYSHRRPRGVRDAHTACPCNAIWSCSVDHSWMHKNPKAARSLGLHLSRYEAEPWALPVRTTVGWVLLDCEGGYLEVPSQRVDTSGMFPVLMDL